MKTLIALTALLFSAASFAQNVVVQSQDLGTSIRTQQPTTELALPVLQNDIYHVPQYMPNYPTAASIWPRIVDVPCVQVGADLKCDGYEWSPKYGRGEYLFFHPVVAVPVQPSAPQIVPVIVERKVYIEVPTKPKKE